MALSLWEPRTEYCGIDVKYLPHSHVLVSWSMTGGAAYKAVEPLGDRDVLEKMSHWGRP